MFATGYPILEVFVSTFYFIVLVFWILLVFHIFQDVFRSHDLSGGAKALWVLFILMLPLFGCLIYLVARGGSMHERQVHVVKAQQKAFEEYIRQVSNTKE